MFKKEASPVAKAGQVNNIVRPAEGVGMSKMLAVLLLLLVVLAGGGAYGSWHYYNKYKILTADPNVEAKKQTEAFVSTLSKLMELPKDETPTVATISDKEKLASQAFFKMAENGDVLFAYTTAMKAILYRPSTNKIINVAPISINQPQNLTQGTQQGTPISVSPRVAYYNGTEAVGLAATAEKAVQGKYPNYQTVSLKNASSKDYAGTLVVDISKKFSQEASDIAQLLNGKVGSLPAGEPSPDADILIISGK